MIAIPNLVLLGYQATRPHLRVLRLPEENVEPSPVRLDAANTALDDAIMRDGWVAILASCEQWVVPLPLTRAGERFGRWWDCVPSLHPRRVWCAAPFEGPDAEPDADAPVPAQEYDGVGRRTVRELLLPTGARLEAEVPRGLVFRGEDGLYIWDINRERAGRLVGTLDFLACHGSTVAVLFPRQLVLIDTDSGRQLKIRKPVIGDWQRFDASFSPDGSRLALAIREEGTSGATRLALIDVATGGGRLVQGRFENFATTPVWTRDGRWLFFNAPFDMSLFACDTHQDPPRLQPFLRRRGRPSPLADITF